MLDITNERLIGMLETDAKLTNKEIANRLGLTEGAVRKRIKKLEEEHVIIGYKARIRYHLLDKTMMIVGLDIAPESFNEVMNTLKQTSRITELYATTGDHSAIFVASVDSNKASEFISGIEQIKGIRHVYPALVQETLK